MTFLRNRSERDTERNDVWLKKTRIESDLEIREQRRLSSFFRKNKN
jgi:hypothetical protein